MKKVLIFDFEVRKFNWGVQIFEVNTQTWVSIEDDPDKLRDYVDKNRDTLWIGFNSKNYDNHILKCIYGGLDPYAMSDWIINQHQAPYNFLGYKRFFFLPILTFDLKNDAIKRYNMALSLKEYEANIGVNIHENGVPFDLDRPMTEEEKNIDRAYCKADVYNSYLMFQEESQQNVLLSQVRLCSLVEKPLEKTIHKTTAQLAAEVLQATRFNHHDEDYVELPNFAQIKDKRVLEFFSQKLTDSMSLKIDLDGVEYKFGLGGLHSAIPKYVSDKHHWHIDVTSFYPSLIIQHKLGSRAMFDPAVYERIYTQRLQMKKNHDAMADTYKLILNIKYGAMDSEYNPLYDKKNRRKIAIWGQILLFDLVEKLAPHCVVVQTNTDGIIVLPNEGSEDLIKDIVSEWEARTKMGMEYDSIDRIVQGDVNNYAFRFTSGKWELKGGMLKFGKNTSNYKRSMTILDKATAAYLLEGKPIEDTIFDGKDILDYQYIAKATHLYPTVYQSVQNKLVEVQRVNRLFPTTDLDYGLLQKFRVFKGKNSYTKFINAPEHSIIVNNDIRGITDVKQFFRDIDLDYQWYIDQARKRVVKFLGKDGVVPWQE